MSKQQQYERGRGTTYITLDHFHFSSMAHVWSFNFLSEVSSLLSSQISVLVL